MSKRGLSVEEKRTRLLELFKESQDFYKLAELEKIAPKLKGITQQSVKEVLQELVDDGLVKSDKIGAMKYISQLSDSTHPSTNPNSVSFYWCFPSDVGQSLANTEEKLKASVEALTKELEVETAIVQVERDERVDSDERTELLGTLADLQSQLKVLEQEDAQYASCDPRLFAQKKALILRLQNCALQWTENISWALTYFRDSYGAEFRDSIKEQLSISDDFEDLSFPPL